MMLSDRKNNYGRTEALQFLRVLGVFTLHERIRKPKWRIVPQIKRNQREPPRP